MIQRNKYYIQQGYLGLEIFKVVSVDIKSNTFSAYHLYHEIDDFKQQNIWVVDFSYLNDPAQISKQDYIEYFL